MAPINGYLSNAIESTARPLRFCVSWETDIPISFVEWIAFVTRREGIVVKASAEMNMRRKNDIEIELKNILIFLAIAWTRPNMAVAVVRDAAHVECFLVCAFIAKVYRHLFISNHIQLRIESTLFHILYSLLHLNSVATKRQCGSVFVDHMYKCDTKPKISYAFSFLQQ